MRTRVARSESFASALAAVALAVGLGGCAPPRSGLTEVTHAAPPAGDAGVGPRGAADSPPAGEPTEPRRAIRSESGVPATPPMLEPFAGVRVTPGIAGRPGRVELDVTVVLDEGWLEQVACAAGTREHESLVVPDAAPSELHAALLLAGHEPGRPGRWRWDDAGARAVLVPPDGDRLRVLVAWGDEPPVVVTEWIVAADGTPYPETPFVFGGSAWLDEATGDRYAAGAPPDDGRSLVYVADRTGSIVGLVTFGDEVVGAIDVIPDQAAVAAPEWTANGAVMPPPGTRAKLIFEAWEPSPE